MSALGQKRTWAADVSYGPKADMGKQKDRLAAVYENWKISCL